MDSNTITAYAIGIQANVATFLSGEPATSKSAITLAVARTLRRDTKHDWPIYVMISSHHNPEDYGGIPTRSADGKFLELLPLRWVHDFTEAVIGDEPAIIFLDEMNDDPQKQACMMRIMFGTPDWRTGKVVRYVGDVPLGPNVRVVGAYNPADIAATGQLLRPTVANRGMTLQIKPNPLVFLENAIAGFPDPAFPILPEHWQDHIPSERALAIGFGHARPDLMHKVPREKDGNLIELEACGPWPSFRTWEMVWTLLAADKSVNVSQEVEFLHVSGCIGEGAAMEYMSYRRNLDIPNPEDLLANPDSVIAGLKKAKGRSDIIYATLTSVVSAVLNRNTPGRWNKGISVLSKAYTVDGVAAFAGLNAKTLANNRPKTLKDNEITPDIRVFAELLKKADLWGK